MRRVGLTKGEAPLSTPTREQTDLTAYQVAMAVQDIEAGFAGMQEADIDPEVRTVLAAAKRWLEVAEAYGQDNER